MAKEIFKITYVGKDFTFYQKLQESFKQNYNVFDYDFQGFPCEPKERIQSIVREIASDSKLIIVDLSIHPIELLQLCRMIKRTNGLKDIFMMGLFDQQIDENILRESIITGIKINHLKTSDNGDFLYDTFCALFPEKVKELNFAVAELSDEIKAGEFIKGGYITVDKLHAEGDIELNADDEVRINSFLTDTKILSSNVMKVKNVSQDNIFYNFQYSYDLHYKYVDLDETSDAERYVEAVESAKHRLNKWLSSKNEISQEKKTRIFIIDRDLNIYKEAIKIDAYPFMVRCQPYLEDVKTELSKNNPHIIIFGFDPLTEEKQNFAVNNDLPALTKIVEYIKSRHGEKVPYEPFLVIFNSVENKETLKLSLGYEKMMAISGEITAEVLIKMGQLFEAKWQKKVEGDKPKTHNPHSKKPIFLSKESPMSILELERKLYLKTISESEVTFNADFTPKMYASYKVREPFNLFLTVVPHKKEGNNDKSGAYRAVINAIGEEQKGILRQFINAVYFRDLEETKKEDRDSLEQIKKSYLDKKEEEAKKLAEANKKASDIPESLDKIPSEETKKASNS